jgi:hypothetical protein
LFDHVQTFVDLSAQRFRMQIPTEENRLDGFAQFGKGLVGWVLQVLLGEAPQDGFRFSRPQAERSGVLDHLIVLLTHQIPVDGLAEDQSQVRIRIGITGFRASWQNVLRKPSQNVRFINTSYFLDLRHAHWLRPRLDR